MIPSRAVFFRVGESGNGDGESYHGMVAYWIRTKIISIGTNRVDTTAITNYSHDILIWIHFQKSTDCQDHSRNLVLMHLARFHGQNEREYVFV